MTTYVDSSALLKRYIDEPDSAAAEQLLLSDPVLVTSWITVVEVRRNLARLVEPSEIAAVRTHFLRDLDQFALVAVDEVVCQAAAEIGEHLGVRTLDALHLACAQRLLIPGLSFITFDLRLAQAARAIGFTVLGA
ncbi:MAG: type II toxin-antitoxin system VapC family toxin [Actinomycetia bacterium]|nr:type II toxin-antitoxin system VapC family toxin [Actinomycetes bacterium]